MYKTSTFLPQMRAQAADMLRHVDLIEIFILLFADDVILMSHSVCGLQNQLNILYETVNRLGLVVNVDLYFEMEVTLHGMKK